MNNKLSLVLTLVFSPIGAAITWFLVAWVQGKLKPKSRFRSTGLRLAAAIGIGVFIALNATIFLGTPYAAAASGVTLGILGLVGWYFASPQPARTNNLLGALSTLQVAYFLTLSSFHANLELHKKGIEAFQSASGSQADQLGRILDVVDHQSSVINDLQQRLKELEAQQPTR